MIIGILFWFLFTYTSIHLCTSFIHSFSIVFFSPDLVTYVSQWFCRHVNICRGIIFIGSLNFVVCFVIVTLSYCNTAPVKFGNIQKVCRHSCTVCAEVCRILRHHSVSQCNISVSCTQAHCSAFVVVVLQN